MKLNAPKQITWWIALILGALGLLGTLVAIPVLSTLAFWLALVGLVLLLVATFVTGL
jgi:heme/copper-type cytochrome/quinol oxidase subunit 1